MLITLCYSVLTWIQSRQRREIQYWVEECALTKKASLLLCRKFQCDPDNPENSDNHCHLGQSESFHSDIDDFALLTPSKSRQSLASSNLSSKRNSNVSLNSRTPVHDHQQNSSTDNLSNRKQISHLCYNHSGIKIKKLLWDDEDVQCLALYPHQVVGLHEWTSFAGIKIDQPIANLSREKNDKRFYILLEAEPGATLFRHEYRKFCKFGEITAWRCDAQIGLILLSDITQLVELMHIFRLGQIVLEGGWRIFRLTTVYCEGTIGTLISKEVSNENSLNAGDLRRISSGIYDKSCETPKTGLSRDPSKYDITTISEEILNGSVESVDLADKLPNWYERSPKKRSIATIPLSDRPNVTPRRRIASFCSGNLNQKSSSFASLLLCSRSISIEEEEQQQQDLKNNKNSRKSLESLTSLSTKQSASTPSGTTSTRKLSQSLMGSPYISTGSTSTGISSKPCNNSSKSITFTPYKATPNRLGKPPNILVLCQDSKLRAEITSILKSSIANDRYAIYEIKWDQLKIGGWSAQAALLVISGTIPDPSHTSLLLEFLGDGGRIFSWCCETHPFGLEQKKRTVESHPLLYGNNLQTSNLALSGTLWKPNPNSKELPAEFPRVLETNDSDHFSRPLTTSIFARVKETQEIAVIFLDGGSLGGKAILSQVRFEENPENEGCQALLSHILGQNLGVSCTRIKVPEYTQGYLLGDYIKIRDFLASIPTTVQQTEMTLEFIPRGEKCPKASHQKLPVIPLLCPDNFSTLKYYENLNTEELGRLVIYTDVISSTMTALDGHFLHNGVVVIARRQTTGKGRDKNIWLSPEGCSSFSFQLITTLDSQIGRRISLIQHLAALSVILAVPQYKDIILKVKWPNDIYLDGQKIGGVLVESKVESEKMSLTIGIGVNVSNEIPTISLNSVLPPPDQLSYESLIAKCLTEFEKLLKHLEKIENLDELLNLYKEHWIHNEDDLVNVEISPGNFAQCNLQGIDEFGFLRVREISTGHIFSVKPDGNSFDIASRLIAIK